VLGTSSPDSLGAIVKIETKCALCGDRPASTLVYGERLDGDTFTTEVFSARRVPDRRHYAWVRCNVCTLLRSDPISDADLSELYAKSTFDYGAELEGLTRTYIDLIKAAIVPSAPSGTLLEVGGGNGFVLDAALDIGFDQIVGVEPSHDAIARAPERVRDHMIADIMRPGLVPDNSVDVVAIFHTLDHLSDPVGVLQSCLAALKPGGVIVCAVHDERAVSARVMREKSPIFDVEHMYLFSKRTGPAMLRKAGFERARASSYVNKYSMSYLFHLLPMPRRAKDALLASSLNRVAARLKLRLPLGNIMLVGVKPNR
jgi:SAM-dependent methyltransferase